MKKFLTKLCVFIFISSAILLVLNYLYIPISTQNFDTDRFRDMPERIRICNLGSSHTEYGFRYDEVSDKFPCFNFSFPSQTLMYDYRLLQNYVNRIDEGGIVFIAISYFSLFGRPEDESDLFIAMNNRYYKILPPNLIKNYDFMTDFIINDFPIMTLDMKNVYNAIRGINEVELQMEETADRFLDYIKELGEKQAAVHMKDVRAGENGNIFYSQERTEALHNIIALCREKKLIPILITTPYLREYYEPAKRDTEFMKVFRSTMNDIIESEKVRYYDYSEDERFSHNYKLFFDTDHLNRKGALEFTKIVLNDVMRDLEQ